MCEGGAVGIERGSVAGIELLTRTSLNSLKDATQVSSQYIWGALSSQPMDDRNWSWAYLRQQFRLKDLESLYLQYQHQLHKGFFSVFLIVQLLISSVHIGVLFISAQMWRGDLVVDVLCYSLMGLAVLPGLLLVYKKKNKAAVVLILSALLVGDLLPSLWHSSKSGQPIRPAYPTVALLAIYAFLPVVLNRTAAAMALSVSLLHIVVLASVTYRQEENPLHLVASEAVYLACVNFLGLYFRFVNEVVIRRTFLDRRACVESTLRLNFEKEQEEQLMLSILPKYIASRVKADIKNIFQQIKTHQNAPLKQKPFRELYVEEHDNVSILYADVVNYSQLTVSLPPKKLVETLHELFTRFDEASEEHGVLRIKFLGDCYYCVCGIPQPNADHAKACVDLGLDMISIIKEVREDRQLEVDMRIGVHTGKVLSGVLGVCKWQYDVWSKDVVIANHMEQAGKPGRVHVTKDTMDCLSCEYDWEPGHGDQRDPVLASFNIETFLISSKHQSKTNCRSIEKRRTSSDIDFNKGYRSNSARGNHGSETYSYVPARQTMFMENNLIMYQQMLRKADQSMANVIKQMPIGNYKAWVGVQEVNPLCLTFQELTWELPFLKQPDPLFKFYLTGSLVVLTSIRAIQWLGGSSSWPLSWAVVGLSAAVLIIILPVSWIASLWLNLTDPHQELDLVPEPSSSVVRLLYRASLGIVWSTATRTLIYLLISSLLAASSLVNLIECNGPQIQEHRNHTLSEIVFIQTDCLTPWDVTETCSLAVIMCFLFLKVHFQLKLLVASLIVTAHAFSVWTIRPSLFQSGATWNPGMVPQASHVLHMLFLTITLHLLDRQVEYMNRLDYRWKRQLAEEQEEAATTRTVNKMLLQNILPIHVAELYLNTSRPHEELYHEQYQSVAVLFATLIEPALTTGVHNERSSLEVLNHVICGFDKLLFESAGQGVEKIKVAGRTYMAACGLEPGRRSDFGNNTMLCPTAQHSLVTLTRFAVHMMKVLDKYNKNNGYNFQIKVGIAHGAVSAGVVGSQKPLYDIWGDAVNLAARMDSTGLPGKIQVPEATAKALELHGVSCDIRGLTYVKGKDYMTTYFVSESYKLQVSTPIITNERNTVPQVTKL